MRKNTFRGIRAVVIGVAAVVGLVAVPALSASASAYYNYSVYKSSDGGASLNGINGSNDISMTNSSIGVRGDLYDDVADGKGATAIVGVNFYNSSDYFVGQKSSIVRALNGAGTHASVDELFSWYNSLSKRAEVSIEVCNGKSSTGTYLNCGTTHYFSYTRP